jgi:hypothetical protein
LTAALSAAGFAAVSAYSVASYEDGVDTPSHAKNPAQTNQVEYSNESTNETAQDIVDRITREQMQKDLAAAQEEVLPPQSPLLTQAQKNILRQEIEAEAAAVESRLAQQMPSSVMESPESSESASADSEFTAEIAEHKAITQLGKNEVLFLDAQHQIVGEPFVFQDFVDIKVKSDGSVMDQYLYTPGKINAAGFPEGGIAGEWLDYVQAQVQADYPEQKIHARVNVVPDFQAAYAESDEPELVAGIESGEISHYDDIVSYFAEKPVNGAEHLNRMEYAQKRISFRSHSEAGRPAVPQSVQEEFKKVLPGLLAHESKFNAGLTSSTGAKGLAQIMPATWQEYKGDTEVSLRMDDQLDVVGKLVSDNYHYLTHYAENELPILRSQFESKEEFETELVTPLLVNAYNVGGPAIGLLVKEFVQHTPADELLSGKDLYMQFRDFAQSSEKGKEFYYGSEAGKYVTGVYGNTAMLEEKYPPKHPPQDYRIAQN